MLCSYFCQLRSSPVHPASESRGGWSECYGRVLSPKDGNLRVRSFPLKKRKEKKASPLTEEKLEGIKILKNS